MQKSKNAIYKISRSLVDRKTFLPGIIIQLKRFRVDCRTENSELPYSLSHILARCRIIQLIFAPVVRFDHESSSSLPEVMNRRKFQIVSHKSGHGCLREVVAYEKF